MTETTPPEGWIVRETNIGCDDCDETGSWDGRPCVSCNGTALCNGDGLCWGPPLDPAKTTTLDLDAMRRACFAADQTVSLSAIAVLDVIDEVVRLRKALGQLQVTLYSANEIAEKALS